MAESYMPQVPGTGAEQALEVLKRPGATIPREQEQAAEDLGGDQRITGGTVTGPVVEIEMGGEVIERGTAVPG
jgi:hypothetical protein